MNTKSHEYLIKYKFIKSEKLLLPFFILFCLHLAPAKAQAPDWAWAKGAGGTNSDDRSQSITTDAFGNVYITGYFTVSTITFGALTLNNTDNTDNTGSTADFFIVKYDAFGNVLWANNVGGAFDDYGLSITTDLTGNVFVAGHYGSASITFGAFTLTNAGGYDIFIVKYDALGNVIWATGAEGIAWDLCDGLATDTSGNLYVTGFYDVSITFGTFLLTNFGSTNFHDIFIVKFDPSGNVIWAKSIGGNLNDCGHSITTDTPGNVYVTGYFESDFITFGTTTLVNEGSLDMFVVKYDASGNVLWANAAGGTELEDSHDITVDTSGNVSVIGRYASAHVTFGTNTLTNSNSGGYNQDVFIVQYNALGNVIWANNAGETNMDDGLGIASDASGNVYITGAFAPPNISFGPLLLNNVGNVDIFVVKYDNSGNVVWAKATGGTGADFGEGITIDAMYNIYLTGWFNSPFISFGTTTLTNPAFNGSKDIFVAKLDATTVGIEEKNAIFLLPEGSNLWLYPNPSTGLFTFNHSNKINTVEVYNILGELVLSQGNAKQINLQSYPTGIYVARINGTQVCRLVKE